MGWKTKSGEEPLAQAQANEYKKGAHREQDGIKDKTKYVRKTLKDQRLVLERYEKYALSC